MTESLRALLSGAIDYAGMFPPAGLPLEQALAKYRVHRAGPAAWMLGRFVCSAGHLGDLGEMFRPGRDGRVTVVVPSGETGDVIIRNLDEAAKRASNFPDTGAVDSLEFRGSAELAQTTEMVLLGEFALAAAHSMIASRMFPATMFFELPPLETRLADSAWRQWVRGCVRALADYNLTSHTACHAGFKLRCGGAGPSAIPSSGEVAAVICGCRDTKVFWKATAGLHHPFRHFDPALGVPIHGFINLLTAAVMADVHRLDAERVQAILEDDDPWHFRFTNEALTWRELSAMVPQIVGARERALRSFGSCSIEEPWQDLTVLGLV